MTDNRTRTGRNAEIFTVTVLGVAVLVMVAAAWASARDVLAIAPTVILALGGIGAFVATYRVWRAGGEWRIWHAAGWALFILMTVYAAFGASSLIA